MGLNASCRYHVEHDVEVNSYPTLRRLNFPTPTHVLGHRRRAFVGPPALVSTLSLRTLVSFCFRGIVPASARLVCAGVWF